jgi:hypothetical protein
MRAMRKLPVVLTRLRGLGCFSRVGSLKIKWLAEKVFTTELGFVGSEMVIYLRNQKQEAIRRHFAGSLRVRNAFRNRVGLHYSHFWPKSTTPLVANQLLSHGKNLKIPIFESESANSG